MTATRTLSIVSRKYDASFRFRLEVDLLYESPTVLLGMGRPGRLVTRRDSENRPDNWSLEYLPLNKPYNIVSVFDLDGSIQYHFCNVLTAPVLDGRLLSYVDLDLDVVVWPDGTHEVQDRDEFEENAKLMRYPDEMRALAEDAARELMEMAREGGHLFGCRELEEATASLLALYATAPETAGTE